MQKTFLNATTPDSRLTLKKVYVGPSSVAIQQKLFKLGFKWNIKDKETVVIDDGSPFLVLSKDGIIYAMDNANEYFHSLSMFKEVSADYILNLD